MGNAKEQLTKWIDEIDSVFEREMRALWNKKLYDRLFMNPKHFGWTETRHCGEILYCINGLYKHRSLPEDVLPLRALLSYKATILPKITKNLNGTQKKDFLEWATKKADIVAQKNRAMRLPSFPLEISLDRVKVLFNTVLSKAIKDAVDSYSQIIWD